MYSNRRTSRGNMPARRNSVFPPTSEPEPSLERQPGQAKLSTHGPLKPGSPSAALRILWAGCSVWWSCPGHCRPFISIPSRHPPAWMYPPQSHL